MRIDDLIFLKYEEGIALRAYAINLDSDVPTIEEAAIYNYDFKKLEEFMHKGNAIFEFEDRKVWIEEIPSQNGLCLNMEFDFVAPYDSKKANDFIYKVIGGVAND